MRSSLLTIIWHYQLFIWRSRLLMAWLILAVRMRATEITRLRDYELTEIGIGWEVPHLYVYLVPHHQTLPALWSPDWPAVIFKLLPASPCHEFHWWITWISLHYFGISSTLFRSFSVFLLDWAVLVCICDWLPRTRNDPKGKTGNSKLFGKRFVQFIPSSFQRTSQYSAAHVREVISAVSSDWEWKQWWI